MIRLRVRWLSKTIRPIVNRNEFFGGIQRKMVPAHGGKGLQDTPWILPWRLFVDILVAEGLAGPYRHAPVTAC